MNELETKEYLEKLQQLKLSDSSRARIQDNLFEYARFHGVRAENESRLIVQVPRRTSLLTLFKQPKPMTAVFIAIALIAGGGTSYAAQGTIPGDLLYPVKTEVNETIRSTFALSNESEAELQAELAKERLEEAEALAVKGELTADASTRLGTQIKNHYDEAMARSAAAEAEGNYQTSASVRASLEGSFRTYAAVLTNLGTTVSGNNSKSLITEINTYADTAAKTQVQASTTLDTSSVDMKATAEATIMKAEILLAQVTIDLSRAKASLSTEAYARTEAKLEQATILQTEARASLEAGAYTEAYNSAQTALRVANEVEVMIDSMLRLDIDLKLDTNTTVNTDINLNGDENQTEPKKDTIKVDVDATLDSTTDTDLPDVESTVDSALEAGLNL